MDFAQPARTARAEGALPDWVPERAAPDGAPLPADLFAKCASPRLDEYKAAQALGMLPFFVEMGSEAAPVIEHQGRSVVMLGSNNYLGLTTDRRLKDAAAAAIERFGTGCTGSRLMNGTLPLHRELEEELADWVGTESALVFTTGYSVNLGLLSTLVDAGDLVLADIASHASIIDGGRLAPGTLRLFRHNDARSLERRLRSWRSEHAGGGVLVAVDGIYSMEGDVAPVAEVAEVCSRLGARLLVDEAHAIGVLGPQGAGSAAAAGVLPDLVMGTFSKSMASCGGFVAASSAVIDYLRIACRPLLFTASGVPAALGAALAALRVARAEEWRREAVRARARQLREGLLQLGYKVPQDTPAAIVPIHLEDEWSAGRLWRQLLDGGVYTNCAVAPAVPSGTAVLRTSVMATHSEADIERALGVFEAVR